MAQAQVPRLFHSVALLLPDGRVVAAGGNPEKGLQVPWPPPDPREEKRLEVFSPPYLLKGPRPGIDDAPEEVHYGATIAVRTEHAGEIRWVSLIRPGLTTHSFIVEQRLVDVPFQTGTDALQASLTNEPNLAPSGWYVFSLTQRRESPPLPTGFTSSEACCLEP